MIAPTIADARGWGCKPYALAPRPDQRAVDLHPSQVLAAVTEQESAQHKPADRDPSEDTQHVVVPVQGQRKDPEQDNHDDDPGVQDDEPSVHGFYKDRFAGPRASS